jgi:anti-anti-sigma factor
VVDLAAFSTFFIRQWWIMRQGFKPVTILPEAEAVIVNNTAVLTLSGRLTIQNYQAFYEIGQRALTVTPHLVINLAQTDFLDSSAIGLLIELSRQTREKGGELWLASVPPTIERTLTILHLENFFVFCPTVEEVFEQRGILLQTEDILTLDHQADKETLDSSPNWAIFKLPRRLDALTSPEVLEKCRLALDQHPYLILDLTDTVFLASAGLAALAKLNRMAQESAGKLRVANCSKDVLKVIGMVRFDKVLALFPDIPSAMV